jgi:hypothetical protein
MESACSLVAALGFSFVSFACGAIWTLHCIYVMNLYDAAVNWVGIMSVRCRQPDSITALVCGSILQIQQQLKSNSPMKIKKSFALCHCLRGSFHH